MESTNKKELIDILISFFIALVGTWAFCKYLFVPFLGLFGHNLAWWAYILLFILFFGSAMGGLTKAKAEHKIAYGSISVINDQNTKFCPNCKQSVKLEDSFCSHCGVRCEGSGN